MSIHIPTRGPCNPAVFYSVPSVALHLIGKTAEGRNEPPTASTRLVEVTREGAEGVANAQTIRAMANGPAMFDLISKVARHGMTDEAMAEFRRLDHEITG